MLIKFYDGVYGLELRRNRIGLMVIHAYGLKCIPGSGIYIALIALRHWIAKRNKYSVKLNLYLVISIERNARHKPFISPGFELESSLLD